MTDYQKLFGIRKRSEGTSAGDSRGVKIAILDTGVPSICGIDVKSACNMTSGPSRDTGHATFIGSLIAGKGEITGVCPDASLYFIKVFDNGIADPFTIAKAINMAVGTWKVDLINLSLGFSRAQKCPLTLSMACKKACSEGVAIVAAAGNDGGRVLWPAALPEVICVGSTDGLTREEFSNHGEVDFVMPGKDLEGYAADGSVTVKSGTSFSTALVTGMLAALISSQKPNFDKASVRRLKSMLISRCLDLDSSGYDENTGYGMPLPMPKGIISRIGLWLRSIYVKIIGTLKKSKENITHRRK